MKKYPRKATNVKLMFETIITHASYTLTISDSENTISLYLSLMSTSSPLFDAAPLIVGMVLFMGGMVGITMDVGYSNAKY